MDKKLIEHIEDVFRSDDDTQKNDEINDATVAELLGLLRVLNLHYIPYDEYTRLDEWYSSNYTKLHEQYQLYRFMVNEKSLNASFKDYNIIMHSGMPVNPVMSRYNNPMLPMGIHMNDIITAKFNMEYEDLLYKFVDFFNFFPNIDQFIGCYGAYHGYSSFLAELFNVSKAEVKVAPQTFDV